MMLPRVLSFLFGAYCLSLLATKFILLAIHAPTVPAGDFLLFFPTFFVPDLLAIGGARLLLRTGKSWLSVAGAIIGTFLACVCPEAFIPISIPPARHLPKLTSIPSQAHRHRRCVLSAGLLLRDRWRARMARGVHFRPR